MTTGTVPGVDLRDVLEDGLESLRADLKELKDGIAQLQEQVGDPLDGASRLRTGLRDELRGHLPSSKERASVARSGSEVPLGERLSGRDFSSGPCGSSSLTPSKPIVGSAVLNESAAPPAPSFGYHEAKNPELTVTDDGEMIRQVSPASIPELAEASDFKSNNDHLERMVSRVVEGEYRSVLTGRRQAWFLFLWRLVHEGHFFDMFMAGAILLNSVCVGLEVQWSLDGDEGKLDFASKVEHVFLTVFVVELAIRLGADGCQSFKSAWFLFDFVLVLLGILNTWILEPVVTTNVESFSSILIIRLVRILRMLRLVRTLRLVHQLKEIYKLVKGLSGSMRSVFYSCIMVLATIYVFACFATEFITKNSALLEDPILAEIVDEHFSSLPRTFYTLTTIVQAGSVTEITSGLVAKAWYLGVFFGVLWLVVNICLINLVTAVIVDNAIVQGAEDREVLHYATRRKLKKLIPTIRDTFQKMDHSKDGKLQLAEVKLGIQEADIPLELRDILEPERLTDFFDYLDADKSGEIDEEEFLDGIFQLVLQSVPLETIQTLEILRAQTRVVQWLRDVACMQGNLACLADKHPKGSQRLRLVTSPVALHIEGGGRSEDVHETGREFIVHMDTPLQRSFPARSAVTRILGATN